MHVLVIPRAIGAVLLGGTLVTFVPAVESKSSLGERVPAVNGQTCAWPRTESEAESRSLTDSLLAFAEPAIVRETQTAVAQLEGLSPSKEHVKAKVFLSLDKLPAGGKCKFVVILDVQNGWHINANPPSSDNLIATKVAVVAKNKSKQLETKYPEGAEFSVEGQDEPLLVYEGQVEIRGEIQAPPDAAGKTEELEFQVKYQACNEKNCLPPKTLKLAGKIEIVKPGTAVKAINTKYFPAK